MSSNGATTTTYRGGTLEEVLPLIRDELGPEAVIVRQREGVVGGFGGFFGKRCIEIEARPAAVRQSQPSRAVVDAYDTLEPEDGNALLQTLLDQSSPFAVELSGALAGDRLEVPAAIHQDERVEVRPDVWRPAPEAPLADDPATVRIGLLAAGFSIAVADDIVAEAVRTLRPFAPGVPLGDLAQRALARRVRVAAGWATKRRTIALIGPARAGRTLTAAKLCNAYAGAGRNVTALSLEPARKALELGSLTDRGDVGLEIAELPDSLARARLRRSEVVVVDTPPLDPANPRSFAPVTRLLGALGVNETHLLLQSDADLEAGRVLLELLAGPLKPSRILVTGADRGARTCAPVALSLAFGVPISFVADGPLPTAGLHPAEPAELARMALPR
ncbi:MAG: flagellar biosynthesis protein FlhF [Gaiellales bacterium]|jgi:flagellar biosynthesis GTPase FlhF|nr:flagellar biosynthesis protein FlhF [Gaiellales bacterium]